MRAPRARAARDARTPRLTTLGCRLFARVASSPTPPPRPPPPPPSPSRPLFPLASLLTSRGRSRKGYSAHEEVYLAALDLDDAPLAKRCIEVLAGRFPGSFRVRTLQAMAQEAGGRFNEALSAYNAILEDDPANTVCAHARARQAGACSASGHARLRRASARGRAARPLCTRLRSW